MAKKSQNRLSPENCNKVMGKSCMFGKTPSQLSEERLSEIKGYLERGESSHICHTTNKTCRGALQFQAEVFHGKGMIPEPTADSLLMMARIFLK